MLVQVYFCLITPYNLQFLTIYTENISSKMPGDFHINTTNLDDQTCQQYCPYFCCHFNSRLILHCITATSLYLQKTFKLIYFADVSSRVSVVWRCELLEDQTPTDLLLTPWHQSQVTVRHSPSNKSIHLSSTFSFHHIILLVQ